jgi:hypothetical protein
MYIPIKNKFFFFNEFDVNFFPIYEGVNMMTFNKDWLAISQSHQASNNDGKKEKAAFLSLFLLFYQFF